jgi:hypothetical protein
MLDILAQHFSWMRRKEVRVDEGDGRGCKAQHSVDGGAQSASRSEVGKGTVKCAKTEEGGSIYTWPMGGGAVGM